VTIGLPYDVFARELLVVVAYATAAFVCAMRWQQGRWARVGAFAAACGAALTAFSLIAWVLYSNDVRALMDFKTNHAVEDALSWLGVLALVGVLVAILLDRSTRPALSE
jgi:hypothetical protein